MKRDRLIVLCGGFPYFDLEFLLQMSGDSAAAIHLNVKRWIADGTLLSLRRGMYTLAEHLRKADISTPRLANDLYPPSYLTDVWALAFYGLIPDVARELISATRRRPQTFSNPFARFSYRHLSATYFWGFEQVRTKDAEFRCATPEKALIDHWYWTRGEWSTARLREMRLQNLDRIDFQKLEAAVCRMAKPRIMRAYARFLKVADDEGGAGEHADE